MMERPELHHGSIEIVAPVEYMKRPPQPVYVVLCAEILFVKFRFLFFFFFTFFG